MTTKTSWDIKVYIDQSAYDDRNTLYIKEGMTKKVAIYEAKSFVKRVLFNNKDVIVKLQTYDREQIEVYKAINRFSDIIFSKL